MKACLHMVKRKYWLERIETAWRRRNVVWLAGVRRAGKTLLCQSLEDLEYFDCERPAVRRQLEDPEAFLKSLKGKRAALDEERAMLGEGARVLAAGPFCLRIFRRNH